uniref:Photosystem I reaction center subunit XII n=1 Tax=Psilotum nudum TaxID=3240 RepID=Q8WI32_PSINU|nr:photosystem I protein M [Psilotum nudum]AGC26776.1 photosystem I reaction center subunit XII [Psilotum nudum]BAB84199.1 PSI M protein [Psilotum nudum]
MTSILDSQIVLALIIAFITSVLAVRLGFESYR